MCYEERFFRLWGTKQAQKRDEIKTEVERASSRAPPVRPSPETKQTERVERELETV